MKKCGFLLAIITLTLVACGRNEIYVPPGDGMTGTWLVEVDATSGPGTPRFGLEQNGGTLVGTYQGVFGDAPVTGTINKDEFTLLFSVEPPGGEVINVKYLGVVQGEKMRGQVEMTPLGSGTFTGERQP